MKPRTPDAARMEADYLDRLRTLLAGRDPAEAAERIRSAQERIASGLDAIPGDDEVTRDRMAAVLETFGPLESFATPPPAAETPRVAIAAYLAKVRRYPPLRFVVELGVLSFALKIGMAVLLGMAGILPEGKTNTEMMDSREGTVSLLVTACLVAPVVETAIGQWFPLWIASLFTTRLAWRVAFSAVVFTALHLTAGAPTTVAVVPAAVVLAWGFAARRETSRWEAYWTTSAIHGIHNAITVFFYFLST